MKLRRAVQVLASAVVALLAATMVPLPGAQAARAQDVPPLVPDPVPDTPPEAYGDAGETVQVRSCARLRERLDHLARAGVGVAICDERAPGDPADSLGELSLPQSDLYFPPGFVDFPTWCYQASEKWLFHRTDGCTYEKRNLLVFDTRTGVVVGTIEYFIFAYTYSSVSIDKWAYQISILQLATTGNAAGSSVTGYTECQGECARISTDFPRQPIQGGYAHGTSFYETTVPESGVVGYAETTWRYWFENPRWIGGASTVAEITPPIELRCDVVAQVQAGCVFPAIRPIHSIDLSGPDPAYATHIADAQASGLPGGYPNGPPLHRLSSSVLIQANRGAACPPSLPRPDGFSCDEYPYASTWEGAATGGGDGRTFGWCQISGLPAGVTGPGGYSACMIPLAENTHGGSLLGAFYGSSRVLEGDAFFVRIVD